MQGEGQTRSASSLKRDPAAPGPLLRLVDVHTGYGELPILWEISMEVGGREIIGLLGSNGAGKSTLLNTISGLIRLMKGRIFFMETEIGLLNTRKRVQGGITQIPEGRLLFAGLSVEQNLQMGACVRKDKANFRKELNEIYDLFPVLKKRRNQLAGTLSGGEQQMCAIGRGLMAKPRLLLIDELSLGLAPLIVDRILESLRRIYQDREISMIVVEQDVQIGLDFVSRAFVLENGRVVKSGRSEDLTCDPDIVRAYIGV